MKFHRLFRIVFAALLALISAQLCLAGDASDLRAKPVILTSVAQAYELTEKLTRDAAAQGSIDSVEILHIGDEFPSELQAILEWYRTHNITVNFRQVSLETFSEQLDAQEKASAADLWTTVKLIRYEAGATDSEETARRTFKERAHELKAKILHTFGIPKGISWVSFSMKRTVQEKMVEGSLTALKVGMGAFVGYSAMASKISEGQHLNIPLGLLTTAAFTIGFDYWGRAHSAFKGQGWAYDFYHNNFVINRKFYLMVSFLHTFIMREAIMTASHIAGTGFSAGWSDASMVLETSVMGLLGKATFELWIERARRTHSKWWTIGVMTAWGLSYSALQTAAQFQVHKFFGQSTGELFRYTMMSLGSLGFGIEVWRNRTDVVQGFERFKNWISGIHTRGECQTLLLNRVKLVNED